MSGVISRVYLTTDENKVGENRENRLGERIKRASGTEDDDVPGPVDLSRHHAPNPTWEGTTTSPR